MELWQPLACVSVKIFLHTFIINTFNTIAHFVDYMGNKNPL